MKENKSWIHVIVIAVVFIGVYSYTFDSKLAMLGDNASYYMLGKALNKGEGYVNISSVKKSPNNHYPPGYPAIIAGVMLFSDDIVTIKVINGLFALIGVILFYFLTSSLVNNKILAFGVALLVAFNAHILWYASLIMSEVPFLLFSVAAVYFFSRTKQDKLELKDKYLWFALIALIIAYYIRALGVAILAGFVLSLLFKKNWKAIGLYIAVFAVAVAPWFIRSSKLGGGSYMRQLKMINPYQPALGQADFGDFVNRFFNNMGRYITKELPDALFPAFEPNYQQDATSGQWLMGLLLLGIMIFGVIKLANNKWLIIGYLLGTLGILMLWPEVWIGVRFMVPAIPFFLLLTFNGIYQLVRLILKSSKEVVVVSVLTGIILLFQFSAISAIHDEAKVRYSPGWDNYFALAKWLNQNEPNDVVVACGKPSLFHLYANKYTTRYKFTAPEQLIEELEKAQVDYVVIDQVYGNTIRYLLPAVRQYPERFQQVHHLKNPDTYLLKFKR